MIKWSLALVFLGTTLFSPVYGMAQTPPPPAAAPGKITEQAAPQAVEASVSHSALKGLTFKIGTMTSGTIIYYVSTGSIIASGAMAGISALGAFVIYAGNEYAWDYYSPNTNVSANGEAFQATSSLTRNTLKFLTFKPAVTVFNLGTIYWFTESVAATAAAGTAVGIASPIIFYLNNMLWDWYDWRSVSSAPPSPAAATKTP